MLPSTRLAIAYRISYTICWRGFEDTSNRPSRTKRRSPICMRAFLDEEALEQRGLKQLSAEFAKIDAMPSKAQIPSVIAHFNRIGVSAPYTPQVHQDAKDLTPFYEAFGVKEGDKMYLPPDRRISIW
jgi:predicted metalloendopeptidase